MQTSRVVLIACVAACCLVPLVPGASDADVGAKLHEALDRKLRELDTQPPAAAPQPAVPAQQPKTKSTPVPALLPAAQPAPAAVLVVPQAADSEAIAKAREAMRLKPRELETLPPPTAAAVAPRASAPVLAVLPSLDADTCARLRAAVRQRIEEMNQMELAGTQPRRAQDRKLLDRTGSCLPRPEPNGRADRVCVLSQ